MTGATRAEVQRNIREAIAGHIAALRATGQMVPQPTTEVERVSVAA